MEKIRISRNALIIAGAGAVVGLLFQNLIGSLLPVVLGAFLGLVIGIFIFPAGGKRPRIEVVEGKDPTEQMLEQLLTFNKGVRLDPYLEEEVLKTLEAIIDKIAGILARINREYPGSELTYVINRMVTSYLPELLEPYLALSPQSRSGEISGLMNTLQSLNAEIENIISLVEQRKVNEFRVQDTFLRHKFLEKSMEA